MHELYQTYGSGDMRTNPNKAFEMIEKGPVVILSRTQPKAVMVSPGEWDAAARLIQDLREKLERERRLRIANQRYAARLADPTRALSQEAFDQVVADMRLAE